MDGSGSTAEPQIQKNVEKIEHEAMKRSNDSTWKIFSMFCKERRYELLSATSIDQLAEFLTDFGLNMKKQNGEHYKEYSVKTVWNTTAKILQRKYSKEYGIIFNPFEDKEFKKAREARDTLRKMLQSMPEKRKTSSSALTLQEIKKILDTCNEETPAGLQKKFFHILSYELSWRGGEAVRCTVYYFQEDRDENGGLTNRLMYNPKFTKTDQGDNQELPDNKWLIENVADPTICPVRLFRKLMGKRSSKITTDRMFLTPNPHWKQPNSLWYKNMAVGRNELGRWTRQAVENIGLDTKNRKITNRSNRCFGVSKAAKRGVPSEHDNQEHYDTVTQVRSETATTKQTIVLLHIKEEEENWRLDQFIETKCHVETTTAEEIIVKGVTKEEQTCPLGQFVKAQCAAESTTAGKTIIQYVKQEEQT